MRPLKWTVEAIGREFKLAANTVRKILHQGGAEPDGTGCYSTEAVCACLFGDLRAERLRKERQLTKKYQLENAIVEASVLNRGELEKGFAAVADALSSVVLTDQNLTRESKEDFLRNLSDWPLRLEGVGQRQSRLRRAKNGETPDGESQSD